MPEYVRITYIRSAIAKPADQQRTIRALGLRRLHQTRVHQDSPTLRGMMARVSHLISVAPAAPDEYPVATPRVKSKGRAANAH